MSSPSAGSKEPEVIIAGKTYEYSHLDIILVAKHEPQLFTSRETIKALQGMDWLRFKDFRLSHLNQVRTAIGGSIESFCHAEGLQAYAQHQKDLSENQRAEIKTAAKQYIEERDAEDQYFTEKLDATAIGVLLVAKMRTALTDKDISQVVNALNESGRTDEKLKMRPDMVDKFFVLLRENQAQEYSLMVRSPLSDIVSTYSETFHSCCRKVLGHGVTVVEELVSKEKEG
ncbi:MAG: hypothetical protein Q9216_003653 [Gyalolechia sp. 2 TL-2023]